MKWFKHQAHLRRDPHFAHYQHLCGRDWLTGYGAAMVIFEVVAENMEPGSTTAAATFPEPMWQSFTGLHPRTFAKYVERLQKACVIAIDHDGDQCRIEVPKLLKWRDEYSRKSGQAPESVRTMSHKREREREREKRKKKKKRERERPDQIRTLSLAVFQHGRTARPLASHPEETLPSKVDALLSSTHRQLFMTKHGDVNVDRLARHIHKRDGYSSEPSEKFVRAVANCVSANQGDRTSGEVHL